jgi:hypothetical protein
MSHATGMAAAVRRSTESDSFDLAGQQVSTITNNVTAAFSEPLPIKEMIRITFMTGAGKLARQKYDAGAAQAVTRSLKQLGFEEDSGASCVKECAGTFKLQHDTGKNLKTVVVFPNILEDDQGDDSEQQNGGSASNGGSFLPKGSPEEMISMASAPVFVTMIKSRCPAWSQKKACLAALVSIKSSFEELEQKLLSGTPLTDPEQSFYDAVSSTVLDEKQAYVRDQMQQQVESGVITPQEKILLVGQVSEKLEATSNEILQAEKEGKPKKAEKQKGIQEKLIARKEKLATITPKGPHRLKHEAEILKLRAEMQPLVDLEDGAKGRLLSLKETQILARKDEILQEIAELEVRTGLLSFDEHARSCLV